MKKVGIIICDRYKSCAGAKCLRAFQQREGGFKRYANEELELVGYTSCGGCPGGNIEYAPAEMKKNGADIIHLATGFIVSYPPCPYIDDLLHFIRTKYEMEVVLGTHPIPSSYLVTHNKLGTWSTPVLQERVRHLIGDEILSASYD